MKKSLFILMALLPGLIIADTTVWDISTTANGTGKFTTDGSGTMTLTVDALDIGSSTGIVKQTSGTFGIATDGIDYLAPGADFTNSVADTITNLSISVVNGLVTSITINGTTKP